MKRAFLAIPGPMPVKVVISVVIVVVAFIALMFVYDWMGEYLVDTGGGIG